MNAWASGVFGRPEAVSDEKRASGVFDVDAGIENI